MNQTVAIAYIKSNSRGEAIYHGTCGGSNAAVERALRKLAKQLGVTLQDLNICYEAEPTGFVLGRKEGKSETLKPPCYTNNLNHIVTPQSPKANPYGC